MGVTAVVESSWASGLAEDAPWTRFRLGAGVVPVGSTAASEPGGGCAAARAGEWVGLVGEWAAAGEAAGQALAAAAAGQAAAAVASQSVY